MANFSEKEVVRYLREICEQTEARVKDLKKELARSEKELEGYRIAISALTSPEDQQRIDFNANDEITDQEGKRKLYNSDWTYRKKVLFVINLLDKACDRSDIVDKIIEFEPSQDRGKLLNAISGELHKLKRDGIVTSGKPKNRKIKGFLWGQKNWFDENDEVKEEYDPIGGWK